MQPNQTKNRIDPNDWLVRLNAMRYHKPTALMSFSQREVLAAIEEIVASRKVVEAAAGFVEAYNGLAYEIVYERKVALMEALREAGSRD